MRAAERGDDDVHADQEELVESHRETSAEHELGAGAEEASNEISNGGGLHVDDAGETLPTKLESADSSRMKLTREELAWAEDIKELFESDPSLDSQSDFMHAQFALICEGDCDDAVRRVYALQEFRQEYRILDSYEDGCRCLRELIRLFPGLFLSFSFSQRDNAYVLAYDLSKFVLSEFTSSEKRLRLHFSAAYYLFKAFCPDLESIRNGTILLIECADMNWSMKPNFKVFQRLFWELVSIYPFTVYFKYYNTSVFLNVMNSLLHNALPARLKDKIQTGFTFEGGMSAYFLVPTVEAATERVILRIEETLKRRYEMEETFVLS